MANKGRRKKKDGKFVIPTPAEQEADRQQFIEAREREMIQDADNLRHMWLVLMYMDEKISWRMDNLDVSKNAGYILSEEKEYGVCKPVSLVEAELEVATNQYNTQLREYTFLREKFLKVYNFTEDEINKVLFNKIDIREKIKHDNDGKAKQNQKVNK